MPLKSPRQLSFDFAPLLLEPFPPGCHPPFARSFKLFMVPPLLVVPLPPGRHPPFAISFRLFIFTGLAKQRQSEFDYRRRTRRSQSWVQIEHVLRHRLRVRPQPSLHKTMRGNCLYGLSAMRACLQCFERSYQATSEPINEHRFT